MGAELTENTIPAEAGQWVIDQSVSFTKGCYTGQELVARIDSRGGNVPRHLRGVVIEGDVPPVGAAVVVDEAEVGTLTSVSRSPDAGSRSRWPTSPARSSRPPTSVVRWDGRRGRRRGSRRFPWSEADTRPETGVKPRGASAVGTVTGLPSVVGQVIDVGQTRWVPRCGARPRDHPSHPLARVRRRRPDIRGRHAGHVLRDRLAVQRVGRSAWCAHHVVRSTAPHRAVAVVVRPSGVGGHGGRRVAQRHGLAVGACRAVVPCPSAIRVGRPGKAAGWRRRCGTCGRCCGSSCWRPSSSERCGDGPSRRVTVTDASSVDRVGDRRPQAWCCARRSRRISSGRSATSCSTGCSSPWVCSRATDAFRPVTLATVAGVGRGWRGRWRAVWWFTQPVPDGIVNNSHPMHLFVGVAWLAVAMAAQGAVAGGGSPSGEPTRRAVPVAALAHRVPVAHHRDRGRVVVREPDRRTCRAGAWTASYLVLIVAGVALLAAAFGWVEDLAARRAPRVWPVTRPACDGRASGLAADRGPGRGDRRSSRWPYPPRRPTRSRRRSRRACHRRLRRGRRWPTWRRSPRWSGPGGRCRVRVRSGRRCSAWWTAWELEFSLAGRLGVAGGARRRRVRHRDRCARRRHAACDRRSARRDVGDEVVHREPRVPRRRFGPVGSRCAAARDRCRARVPVRRADDGSTAARPSQRDRQLSRQLEVCRRSGLGDRACRTRLRRAWPTRWRRNPGARRCTRARTTCCSVDCSNR